MKNIRQGKNELYITLRTLVKPNDTAFGKMQKNTAVV